MNLRKRVVMIAHDNRKEDLLDWAAFNVGTLSRHELSATGTTGKLLADRLELPITQYLTGPLGGDQQIGAAIAEGRVDLVIFFWDPLEPQPHDVDVKALLRIAVVYNTPIACNRSTADFLLSSPLMDVHYTPFAKRHALAGAEPDHTPAAGTPMSSSSKPSRSITSSATPTGLPGR
jgi:methylglyoxal synthase